MNSRKKTTKAPKSPGRAQEDVQQRSVTTSWQDYAIWDRGHWGRIGNCIDEYIRRLYTRQQRRPDLNKLKDVILRLRDMLEIYTPFQDNIWFDDFKRYYRSTRSAGIPASYSRVALTLDLWDIVRCSSRHERKIILVPENGLDVKRADGRAQLPPTSDEENETPDDCVLIEAPIELIEISDDEESSGTPLKRKLDDNANRSSSAKKAKRESYLEVVLPPLDWDVASDEASSCAESYKDALRLLKPLEEFALKQENSGAMVLLTMLEEVFNAGKNGSEKE